MPVIYLFLIFTFLCPTNELEVVYMALLFPAFVLLEASEVG